MEEEERRNLVIQGRVSFGPSWVWADLVLGRVGFGPTWCGPSWVWAELTQELAFHPKYSCKNKSRDKTSLTQDRKNGNTKV